MTKDQHYNTLTKLFHDNVSQQKGRCSCDIIVADIGGTHTRIALAKVIQGRVLKLGEPTTIRTGGYPTFVDAWKAYGKQYGPLPSAAVIAVAAPMSADQINLTNNPWTLHLSELRQSLGVDELLVLNDFAAIGYAVSQLKDDGVVHLCGPQGALPEEGVITVVGPGTGLGIACVNRGHGRDLVVATAGGHVSFAPSDALEDAILERLRAIHGRVSVERVVSGAGLTSIYNAIAKREGMSDDLRNDKELWQAALTGTDAVAVAALDQFCACLGNVAGDIALAQGASAVIIAGGIGLRLRERLPRSDFADTFVAKGRFSALMENIPVKLVVHPEPGLLGAAAAYSIADW